MAGIINTGSFPKALWPGVKSWYGMAYNDYPVQFDKLFDKSTSDKAWEEIVGSAGLGLAVVKAEGAPVTYDSEQQGFVSRFQHVNYALGFIITEEMITGSATTKAILTMMGQSAERRKQVLIMQQCVTCVAMAKGFISVGLRCIASFPGMKQDVVKKLGNSIFTLIADTMDKYLESMLEDDDSENNNPTDDVQSKDSETTEAV